MSVALKSTSSSHVENDTVPIFTVIIHPNEDIPGYWAECVNVPAFTIGDTLRETQANMYESVSLMLEDDYPDIGDYILEFVMANE